MFLCQCWAFHRSSCKEMVLMDYGGITSHMHIVQAVSFVVIQGMCVCGGGGGGGGGGEKEDYVACVAY